MSKGPVTDWLTLSDAAALLGVHPTTLRVWADRGDVPMHRTPGQHRRFRRADIEAQNEARHEAHVTTGQMLAQHALGHTRLHLAENRFKEAGWYQKLSAAQKQEFRDNGRRLLGALTRYLSDEDASALVEGRAIGHDYERLGRAAHLTLTEKVTLFLYFRDFLYDSVVDLYQAANQRAARDWAHMHRQIAGFTNQVLLALVEAHEAESGK